MACSEFLAILVDAGKIFSKDGKIMTLLALLTLVVNSLLYLVNLFSTKPLIKDLIMKFSLMSTTAPGSPEYATLFINLEKDAGFLFGFEWIYMLISSIVNLFLLSATILASAMINSHKDLSFKNLLSKSLKSLKRPFVTWFYTTLFGTGFIFIFLFTLVPLVLMSIEVPIASAFTAIVLAAVGSVFYVYLSVVWTLALVVSVVEDLCGAEALGKAAAIVKGSKRHGFLLNLLYTILAAVLMQGVRLIGTQKSIGAQIGIVLVWLSAVCLFRMFWLVAFTVFYFKCKNVHGEKVKVVDKMEYTRIPTAPVVEETIV